MFRFSRIRNFFAMSTAVNQVAAGKKRFTVSAHGKSTEVEGRDSVEAWAVFCTVMNLTGWKSEPARGKVDGKPVGYEGREAARAARDVKRAQLGAK